jgi:hypothetical protein
MKIQKIQKKPKRTLHSHIRGWSAKPAKQFSITTEVQRGRDGTARIPLPVQAKRLLGFKPNQRVWVAEGKAEVMVSTKPYGPYPAQRRMATRLMRSTRRTWNGGV